MQSSRIVLERWDWVLVLHTGARLAHVPGTAGWGSRLAASAHLMTPLSLHCCFLPWCQCFHFSIHSHKPIKANFSAIVPKLRQHSQGGRCTIGCWLPGRGFRQKFKTPIGQQMAFSGWGVWEEQRVLVCLVAKGDEAVGKSNIQKSAMGN